jgi:hypothetical protein
MKFIDLVLNYSGIHKFKCKTCNNSYVGQTGRSIGIRYREHTRYVTTNNPTSAYELDKLNYKYE